MLTALHIENIAIIEQLDLEFDRGFTVLTGETGAGKSIIIDSILLLLGNKASKELIRTGSESGIVNASFCELSTEALEILAQNGLQPDDDGNITVFRKIGADGRNNARINGMNVTVSLLKELGEHLINIHGQHDGVLLLDSRRHLAYLDEFGQLSEKKEAFSAAYSKAKTLQQELADLRNQEATKAQRKAELEVQLSELEQCDLKAGEHEELLARRKNLMNNSEITESLHTAATALYDGDIPAAQLVHTALDSMIEIEKLLPGGTAYIQRLHQLSAELDDLGAELGKLFDDYAGEQMDPQKIEERLDQIEAIKKKYGPSDRDVLEHLQNCRAEFDRLENSEDHIHEAEARFAEARTVLEKRAAALTAARQKAAVTMEKQLRDALCYLDMPKIRFKVEIHDRVNDRGGIRYRTDGKDEVEFFLSANAGEELRPLAKIASGGELSRIMLSMKSVLNQSFDTVIYDEVDTGVSGGTAEKIGKKLQSGAGERQVFCITHLAQIAARADHHMKVTKSENNGRVASNVIVLNQKQRIEEVARIMGGEALTDKLLSSAEELIINSKNKD